MAEEVPQAVEPVGVVATPTETPVEKFPKDNVPGWMFTTPALGSAMLKITAVPSVGLVALIT